MIASFEDLGDWRQRRERDKKHLLELRLVAVELKHAMRRISDARERIPDGAQAKADLKTALSAVGMALGEIEREIAFEEGHQ